MEKEFVPYEQALALKELGFDEECLAVHRGGSLYGSGTSVSRYYEEGHWQLEKNSNYNGDNWIAAPTFSQAFRWFREKYKISGEISSDYYLEGKDNEWEYNIYQLGKEDDGYVGTIPIFKTPEDAELACLKKLIEIVKEK